MTITINKQIEEKREIPVPSFWKDPSELWDEYCAVLDGETAVRILDCRGVTTLRMGPPEEMQDFIKDAYNKFDLCTEEEFLNAYNKAHESIRLKPIITTSMLNDSEKVEALRNSIAV